MSLFSNWNKDYKEEKNKRRIAKALTLVNDNYVWEIAESSKPEKGSYEIWLIKIVGEKTVRVEGHYVEILNTKSIKLLSGSLVKRTPESRVNYFQEEKKHKSVVGFYANVPRGAK